MNCKYCGKLFTESKNGLLQLTFHEILHDETLADLDENPRSKRIKKVWQKLITKLHL